MDRIAKPRKGDESKSLLPEVREGAGYDATSTAAGGARYGHQQRRYGRDNNLDNVRPKSSFHRVSGLVVGGIAIVFSVSAAVGFHTNRVATITPGDSHVNLNLKSEKDDGHLKPTLSRVKDEWENPGVARGSWKTDEAMEEAKGEGGEGSMGGAALGETDEVDNPPNVIFILVDDLGMNDVGSTSTDMSAATPFIQSLAEDGVKIIRYYTNHMCTPARVSRQYTCYLRVEPMLIWGP